MKKVKEHGLPNDVEQASFHCMIFEDIALAIELAKTSKMHPQTKYLNINYHHFQQHVQPGLLSLHYVPTNHQIADIITKPLTRIPFSIIINRLFVGEHNNNASK